jgi:hypothetical protein
MGREDVENGWGDERRKKIITRDEHRERMKRIVERHDEDVHQDHQDYGYISKVLKTHEGDIEKAISYVRSQSKQCAMNEEKMLRRRYRNARR